MQPSRDFRELIDCSISRGVRFLIVGGDAVAAHGHPRTAKDSMSGSSPTRLTRRGPAAARSASENLLIFLMNSLVDELMFG